VIGDAIGERDDLSPWEQELKQRKREPKYRKKVNGDTVDRETGEIIRRGRR